MSVAKIDYSQLAQYQFCPWAWYEKYIKGMSRRYNGQRSDPLALGSLVHNILDNRSKYGRMFIDEATLRDVGPTPECVALAELLVRGYHQKYPQEHWPMEYTEAAVEFPLYDPDIYNIADPHYLWYGVAKLDGYFYVPSDTTIESGLPDQRLTLGRGWWSREYKTKSPGIDRGVWMKEWASKRQADFQLLALHNILISDDYQKHNNPPEIRGVLVSVLEKPRDYIPKRKCKKCGGQYELRAFREHADGHLCPVCGEVQKLKPYVPTVPSNPEYFRMIVTRTPEQLAVAREEIAHVAESMQDMIDEGMSSVMPHRDNCISNRYHHECEFAEEHIAGVDVSTPKFIQIDPYAYIGLASRTTS